MRALERTSEKDNVYENEGGASSVELFGSAHAADMATKMPVKAPPVPTPAYDWSGFYLGGYVGSSWSQSNASTPPPFAAARASAGAQPGSIDLNTTGWTGGVTAGYNLQLSPSWLVGVEGDFGYFGGGQLFANFDDNSPGDNVDAGEEIAGTQRCAAASASSPARR